jgi:ribonucrease Y
MDQEMIGIVVIALTGGILAGGLIAWIYHQAKLGGYQTIAQQIIQKAEFEASTLRKATEFSMKQTQLDQQKELEQLWQQERKKIHREEDRLKQREDKLEERMNLVEKKLSDIERREALMSARRIQLDEEKVQVAEMQAKLVNQLEHASGLSAVEAKDILIERITNDVKTDAANLIRRILKESQENAEQEARRIITTAIQRLAVPCVSETTVHTVAIPSDEMKGRIIGREGRNIRTLEKETGVNFVIDETPGAVVLSGFDPIRIQVAKIALTDLISDGRIHPTRIEEAVEKAKVAVIKLLRQHGEDAALRAGAINLHPELIMLLGKLKFRYSFGQNVLDHSIEVSHIMGMMAAELGLDVRLAKRIGLLHDMGKAVSHEVEGPHAVIGHDFALKYGESKEVANGIGCHHQDMDPITIEGSLCSSADAISASRPGARIEAVEEYVKRLQKLEEIASEFTGVEKAYAMQAGREIRVLVLPDLLDDAGTINLARDLAKRIETDLHYPGKIKVTVIREKRAVEYAI